METALKKIILGISKIIHSNILENDWIPELPIPPGLLFTTSVGATYQDLFPKFIITVIPTITINQKTIRNKINFQFFKNKSW